MKTSLNTILLAALSLAVVAGGCSSSGSRTNGGTTGGVDSGTDGSPSNDGSPGNDGGNGSDGGGTLQDGGTIPPVDIGAPVLASATLLTPPTTAAGLVTSSDGKYALYLASPIPAIAPTYDMTTGQQQTSGAPTQGALHLVDTAGHDTLIGPAGSAVPIGGYSFTPDATALMYEVLDIKGTSSTNLPSGSLVIAPVASPTAAVTVVAGDVDPGLPITNSTGIQGGFYAGSTNGFFVLGVNDQGLGVSESMVVINLATKTKVFEVQNGAYGYREVAVGDLLIYQAMAGGTSTTSTPVQTLYSIPLNASLTTSTTPSTITTYTANVAPANDGSALYWLSTSGVLYSQPLGATGVTGTAKQLAPPTSPAATTTVVNYTLNGDGALAYLASDGSIHVLSKNGTETYKTAAKAADLFTYLAFTGEGDSLYFFNYVKNQEQRGILYYLDPSKAANAPVAVFGAVTGLSDTTYNAKATYLYGVQYLGGGTFAAQTNLGPADTISNPVIEPLYVSGSPALKIADGVPGADYRQGYSSIALLYSATLDTNANALRLAGGANYTGKLGITDLTAPVSGVISTSASTDVVAAGNYEWSDNGYELLFIEQSAPAGVPEYSPTAQNYVGTLHIYDVNGGSGDHALSFGSTVPADVVSEIGPVTKRQAFIIATSATVAAARGVYLLSY